MKNVCIRRSRPRSLSKKREAERKAAGETHIHSSIAPSSKPQKLKSHSRPDAKQKRRKPPNRRNVKRHAKEVLRANGPVERREWIKGLPSVVSGRGPCEAAHVANGGTSRKADAKWTVPLTHHEHIDELHHWGPQTFEAHYGIDLKAAAIRTEAAWQDHINRGNAP